MGMGFKAGLIVGAGVGYLIASRIDPQTRDRIETEVNKRVAQLRDDPRVKDMVGSVASLTEDVMDSVGDRVSS